MFLFDGLCSRIALTLFALAHSVDAAVRTVDSIAGLRALLAAAAPGDVIEVQNGVYTADAPIVISCVGTPERPIVIAAASVGGVEIGGTDGFSLVSPAAYIEVRGFRFTHAGDRAAIGIGASHVRVVRNTFLCDGAGAYLTVSGDDCEVAYNEFRDKATKGNMLSVTGEGSQVARRLWIHHNHFHDFAPAHVNGAETIRFGLSGLSMSRGDGLVEYNLFERCTGENELISNKSGGNTYRFNTFLDSPGAQLTLRHGNECVVYGNVFRGTDGLRFFGDRHRIFGNHFEGNSLGVTIGNGGAEVADGAPLTSHDRPDGCALSFNTLIDNGTHFRMTPRTPLALGATNTTISHNVILGGGLAARIEGPNVGAVWSDNVLWAISGPGDVPETGQVIRDPHLAAISGGLRLPTEWITRLGNFSAQPLKFTREVPEVNPGPVAVRPVLSDEVGPSASGG
jgi:poly(beta-D-mannuronate) lyase